MSSAVLHLSCKVGLIYQRADLTWVFWGPETSPYSCYTLIPSYSHVVSMFTWGPQSAGESKSMSNTLPMTQQGHWNHTAQVQIPALPLADWVTLNHLLNSSLLSVPICRDSGAG